MNFFIKILTTFLLFSLLSCSNKTENKVQSEPKINTKENISTNNQTSKTKNILCFGNSLTAGFGLDETEAWPHLLQLRLDSMKKEYTVINAGISGETTSNGLNRLDWVLKQTVDIFILELGANDMLRGLDVKSTRKNLDQIIVKLHEKYPKSKVVIAGMLAPPNMGKDYQKSFDSIFSDLAKKHNAALIPFFLENVATIKELNLQDGKHPNAVGQKIVLENVWKTLSTVL